MTHQEIEAYLKEKYHYHSVEYVGKLKHLEYYAVTMHKREKPTMYHILTPYFGQSTVRRITEEEREALGLDLL